MVKLPDFKFLTLTFDFLTFMIYINFVDPHSLMLHAKFQNNRSPGSKEEDILRFLSFIAMVAILVMTFMQTFINFS